METESRPVVSRARERGWDSPRGREIILASPLLMVAHICECMETVKVNHTVCELPVNIAVERYMYKHICAGARSVAPACRAWGLTVM